MRSRARVAVVYLGRLLSWRADGAWAHVTVIAAPAQLERNMRQLAPL